MRAFFFQNRTTILICLTAASGVFTAVNFVRKADLDDLRNRDTAVEEALKMEIQERKDLANRVWTIGELQQKNTAKIDLMMKELGH